MQKVLFMLVMAIQLLTGCGEHAGAPGANSAGPSSAPPSEQGGADRVSTGTAESAPVEVPGEAEVDGRAIELLAPSQETQTGPVPVTETQAAPETVYVPPAWTPPPLEQREIEVTTDGLTLKGVYMRPLDTPIVGLIVALHSLEGLNADTRDEVRVLAESGYIVFGLDYYGRVPANRTEIARLQRELSTETVDRQIDAAAQWLKTEAGPEVMWEPVLVGWGYGGTLAISSALSGSTPRAIVSYYGDLPVETTTTQQLAQRGVAILGIFAQLDGWVTPVRVETFDAALSEAGVDHQFVTYSTIPGFIMQPRHKADEVYGQEARTLMREFLARRGLALPVD